MIEWNRVTELHDEIGAEDFADIVEVFLEEVDEIIAGLAAGAAPPDLGASLHLLKGSALNLGFSTLAAMCSAGEARANAGRAGDVDLGEIIRGYKAARAAFLSGLDDLVAA